MSIIPHEVLEQARRSARGHGWEAQAAREFLEDRHAQYLEDYAYDIFNDRDFYLETRDAAVSGEILGDTDWGAQWNVEEIRLRDGERENDVEMILEAVTGRRDLMLMACRAYAEWRFDHGIYEVTA